MILLKSIVESIETKACAAVDADTDERGTHYCFHISISLKAD